MKLCRSFTALFFVAGSVNAFQPPATSRGLPRSTCLFANSKNIRAAMEATEMYGPTSPEARLAWEVVEEFDGRDNSAAFQPMEMTEEWYMNAQAELQASLEMVSGIIRERQYNENHMRDVAAEVQAVKLSPPEKKPAPVIPGLWDAKLKARAQSQIYGNDSVEARLAWEEVEELASAGLDNAMGENMTDECLVEAAEACLALEELDRFINHENISEGGLANF